MLALRLRPKCQRPEFRWSSGLESISEMFSLICISAGATRGFVNIHAATNLNILDNEEGRSRQDNELKPSKAAGEWTTVKFRINIASPKIFLFLFFFCNGRRGDGKGCRCIYRTRSNKQWNRWGLHMTNARQHWVTLEATWISNPTAKIIDDDVSRDQSGSISESALLMPTFFP